MSMATLLNGSDMIGSGTNGAGFTPRLHDF